MLKQIKSRIQLFRDVLRRRIGIILFDKKRMFQNKDVSRVLFVRWDSKIGDTVVSSFCFRELKKNGVQVDVITTESISALLLPLNVTDNIYLASKRPSYKELYSLSKKIGAVDLVVHFSKKLKMKDLFFLRLMNTNYIAGLDDEVDLVNLKWGKVTKSSHFSLKFEKVLDFLSVDSFDKEYSRWVRYNYPPEIRLFLEKHSDYVVLNPYGSGSSRKLNATNIDFIIKTINKINCTVDIIILLTPENIREVKEISDPYNNVFFYENTKSIFDSIAIVEKSKCVITVDTAITHIAKAYNKKTFCIYNPDMENFSEWGYSDMNNFFAKKVIPPDVNILDYALLQRQLYEFIREN